MSLLEKALPIAVDAHRGQLDKSGAPYIFHPLRVMARVDSEPEKIVAILHDVIEDTSWTFDQLREQGFPQAIIKAIDCLTRRDGESYERFVERSASNPIARKVKIADLEDNMDIRRCARLTAKDLKRFNRYLRAWRLLTGRKAKEPA